MSDISIKVDSLAGSDIPGDLIPQMVRLADKIGITVEADLNDVLVVAKPGDDPFHLAIAWRRAIKSKLPRKMAFASDGKELMERP